MDVVTLFITFFIVGTVLGAGLQYYREKEKKKTLKKNFLWRKWRFLMKWQNLQQEKG